MSKNPVKSNVGAPCFVCNSKIAGDRVNLAVATAPQSKLGLAEKISQLIGEDFVVVVTDQDVLCKRCVSLLVHMDKLENELLLVKKAVLSYLKQKYNLPIDESSISPIKKVPQQGVVNKQERSGNENEENGSRNDISNIAAESSLLPGTPASAVSAARKRPTPIPGKMKDTTTPVVNNNSGNRPRMPQNADSNSATTPKMKIYKCGFCSFQSKELNNVRLHMKLHVKANVAGGGKPEEESAVGGAVANVQKSVTSNVPAKRRLFRCQVCSASFDEKIKCLEHISKEHTPRKKVEERKTMPELQQEMESTTDEKTNANHADDEMRDNDEGTLPTTDIVKNELTQGIEDPYADDTAMQYDTSGAALNDEDEQKPEEKVATEEESKKEKVHAIDIEAMIAALHSDGPTDTPQ